MPINLYCGNPGSGKSYEVCSVVIFNAIKTGRRVISNVAGLNYDKYKELLLKENKDLSADQLGRIISIDHEEVLNADFWLTDEEKEQSDRSAKENVIQAGDLLVLDEVWRFWNGFSPKSDDGKDSPKTVMNFFRMHRHMVNAISGLSCEVAVITQDVNDIHRRVRNVIDETYRMSKLKALGAPKKYRVDVYSGGRLVKTKLIKQMFRGYNKKYFELYKSHSQNNSDTNAKEVAMDGRSNIFNSKLFYIVLPLLGVLAFFAYRFLHGFFNPEPKDIPKTAPVAQQIAPQLIGANPLPIPEEIPMYEIVGQIKKNGIKYDVVRSTNGRLRYIYGASTTKLGVDYSIEFDGNKVNTWDTINAFINGNNTGYNPTQ